MCVCVCQIFVASEAAGWLVNGCSGRVHDGFLLAFKLYSSVLYVLQGVLSSWDFLE